MIALALLAACAGGPPGSDLDTDTSDGPRPGESDNDHYDRVATELAGYRTPFLDEEADELYARENVLFWLTFPGFDPVLHSWDAEADEVVDYEFSIGSDAYNYRASAEMVVTAIPGGGEVVYEAYALDAPADRLGTATFDSPGSGARWHAYAADGTTAYIVVITDTESALYRWRPPEDPRALWSFDDLGYTLGEFQDFDVEGDTMIFIEGGRIWRADVETGVGEWLDNETAINGAVSYDDEGVVWAGDYSLYWYDYAAPGAAENLTDTINLADYQLNDTYASAHKIVETGFWRRGDALVYESLNGIYRYDLDRHAFSPVVLDERGATDVRVTWRDPVMLDDGTLFVTGLESESGSVGADGPVWRIDLPE